MERAVTVKFPDGFKFPEYFYQKNLKGDEFERAKFFKSSCSFCPLNIGDEEPYCAITGDVEHENELIRHKCPFLTDEIPVLEQ